MEEAGLCYYHTTESEAFWGTVLYEKLLRFGDAIKCRMHGALLWYYKSTAYFIKILGW